MKPISRRQMLKLSAGVATGAILAACAQATTPAPTAVPPTEAPAATQPPAATMAPAAATDTPAPTQPPAPTAVPAKKIAGTVVAMDYTNELTPDLVKAFMVKYPDVTLQFVDGTDLTRFYAMFAAGTPPDSIRVQAPSVPQWLAKKLLFDLTPYFQTSTVIKIDDLMPANDLYKAESPLKIGSGNIYGMVKDFSPDETIWAYVPAFTAVGLPTPDDTHSMTFDEIMQTAKKVTKTQGDRTLMFGYGYEAGWADRFWMVALAEKNENLYSDGFDKIILSANPDAVAIVKWYTDMAQQKLMASPIDPSPAGWNGTDFANGALAMMQYGFWFEPDALSDKTKGNIMMLPAPNWAGQRRDGTITATGQIVCSQTKNPDATWEFFEWYHGGDPAIARAKQGWGVPGLKSLQALLPQTDDYTKQVYKVLQGELALATPPLQFNPFLGETQVESSYAKYLEPTLKGSMKFADMLTTIEGEVNQAIKDGINSIMG
jgi:multiple sugar transport system substrate-binding protein